MTTGANASTGAAVATTRGARTARLARCAVLALLTGVVTILVATAPAQALEQKLVGSGGGSLDETGTSVAIDGNLAVVGAPGNALGKGAVYVFTRSGNTWAQSGKLTASDGATSDRLGISVAIDGDTIVAGANGDDVGVNPEQGSVYTFASTGATARTQTAKLTVSDGAGSDSLGTSVAIDGDVIVAGAPNDDPSTTNTNQGALYTFARTGSNRTETAKLTASDGAPSDALGFSVAVDGDTVVAGAPNNDAAKGAAYTFASTGSPTRTQTAKLTASDAATGDRMAWSVDVDGDTIVAGAYIDDVGLTDQGSVYTFARTGSNRMQTAKLTASDGAASDQLGYAVAIQGDDIVAGANLDDVGTNGNQGSAYTFARTGVDRTETGQLTASDGAADDYFGYSVAVGGDAFLVGVRLDDVSAANQGSASVFFPPTTAPCADDADNDGDTFVDFPDDPGCESETDDSELDPSVACDDDADNDTDGLTDFPNDPGCSGPTDDDETSGPPGDSTPPSTAITAGPPKRTERSTAKFKFTGSDDVTASTALTFECKLDSTPFAACSSPKNYRRLNPGRHTLKVKATDQAENSDPTPATRRWRVKR